MRIKNPTLTSLVCFCLMLASPALASDIIPLPPQLPPPMQFTNNGKISGTLQTQGMTLPITGTLNYLVSGGLAKLLISVDTEQITSDSWVTTTPTVINEWEIVSTDPTTCRMEVFSGDSYPQCTAWQNPSDSEWSLECTATVQGKQATLDFTATLTGNLLASFEEKITISGMVADIIKFTVDSQGSFAPDANTFKLPSICNNTLNFAGTPGAPNCHGDSISALAQQYGGLDAAASSLGFGSVEALQDAVSSFCGVQCTGTIPNICL